MILTLAWSLKGKTVLVEAVSFNLSHNIFKLLSGGGVPVDDESLLIETISFNLSDDMINLLIDTVAPMNHAYLKSYYTNKNVHRDRTVLY